VQRLEANLEENNNLRDQLAELEEENERLKARVAVQGEPVAYLRKDQLTHVKRMGPMLGEIADSPRADRVPVYVAPQPADQKPAQNDAMRFALSEMVRWYENISLGNSPAFQYYDLAKKALLSADRAAKESANED